MQAPVRTRAVFYIPGYDPMPPRRYRELYRSQSQAQAEVSGFTIDQAKGEDALSWTVAARIEGAEVRAGIRVLYWADIVRASMQAGIARTYWLLAVTAWRYAASGALGRLMWLRKGPVIAALYPVVVLLVQAAVALGLGAVPWSLFGGWPGAVLALAVVWAVLAGFRKLDNRFFAYYLMHDYAYSARQNGATPPELAARLSEFGDRIAEALAGDADEVLVVGHSSGAHLAVMILADLIRRGRVPEGSPALSLLTLGHVVPMISFLPGAQALRADLADLAATDRLFWLDVSAPGDGCCFALCDPVAVSGVAPEGPHQPLVISAAFTKTLAPETWARLRWRFFRLHFQYLCAFDRPGDYDYFRVTAGPLSLRDRFGARGHSQSRIATAASPHTDRAA